MSDGEKHLNFMRIPRRYWECRLKYIPDSCPHKQRISSYIKGLSKYTRTGVGLLLWGDYSTGKSGLGSIILKACYQRHIGGLFVTFGDLPKIVIEQMMFNDDMLMIDRIKTVQVLVVDELIVMGDDKFKDGLFEEIVRARIANVKTTIITTNLNPKEIARRCPAMAAALKEAVVPIAVRGHDFRQPLSEGLVHEIGN
jgi:DNA replication protein DnaC